LPEHLQQYDEIVSGSAANIIDAVYGAPSRRQDRLADAEIVRLDKLTDAEIARQDVTVKARIETSRIGQWTVIVLLFVCIAAAIVFFALGNVFGGCAFTGVAFVQLILSIFPPIAGRRKTEEDN